MILPMGKNTDFNLVFKALPTCPWRIRLAKGGILGFKILGCLFRMILGIPKLIGIFMAMIIIPNIHGRRFRERAAREEGS